MDQITSVEILNSFGTSHCKFPVKSVVRLRGTNGAGKSSVLRAIAKLFEGGKDPSIIRQGAKESKVILTTAAGYTLTKRTWITRNQGTSSELTILDPGGNVVPEPATYIKRLSEITAVDPGLLLRIDASTAAGRKELAATLMKIVPMTFDAAELEKAVKIETVKAKPGKVTHLTGDKWVASKGEEPAVALPAGTVTLPEIRKVIKAITDRRQRVGSTKEDAEGSINRLRDSLPSSEVVDYSASIEEAVREQEDHKDVEVQRSIAISNKVTHITAKAMEQTQEEMQAIDSDIDGRVKELEADRSKRKDEARKALDDVRRRVEVERGRLLDEARDEFRPIREAITAKLATLREQAKNEDRAEALRGEIESQTRTAWESGHLWTQLTEAKDRLETLMRAKLENLPVSGLEVTEEGVTVEGIAWQNVNLARRVQIVVEICARIAGEMGFMLLDDVEHLAPDTLRALESAIVESGFQLIEAMVDGDCEHLKIEQVA